MRRFVFSLLMVLPLPAMAQQTLPDRTLMVSGTGTVEREPDQAHLHVAVENVAPTAEEAARANAERTDAVIRALRAEGIPRDETRTVSYSVYPEYGRPGPDREQEPRIVGYRASNTIRITIEPIERAGPIIDTAIAAGANRVTGLTFGLRDPESARLDALQVAMARARAEAEVLASAAGERLGPIVSISTTGPPVMPFPRPAAMEARVMDAVPTPIEPGTLTVSASVNIIYGLAP